MSDKSYSVNKGVVVALVLVAVAIVAVFNLMPAPKEPVRIGAVIPKTGPASHLVLVLQVMTLATEEINSAGGINGRKMEIVFRDSKSDPEEAAKAFLDIESSSRPLLYVSSTSSVSMRLKPLAEEHGVVLFGLVVSAPEFSARSDWAYRYYPTAKEEVDPVMALLEYLRVKKLGILYQGDEYGESVFARLKGEFEEAGGRVVGRAFAPGEEDLSGQAGALAGVEAVYVVGFPRGELAAIKALRQSKFSGHIIGASGCSTFSVRSDPAAEGMYLAAPIIYKKNYPLADEVRRRYEEMFDAPLSHQAANGYDFVKIIAGLLEDGEVSRRALREMLEGGFSYSGILGYADLKAGEHDIVFPLYPARVVSGELDYVRLR